MPFLAPIGAAVAAFAGTFIGQAVIGIGLSIASSMLSDMLAPKTQQQRQPGFQLSVTMGDDNPISFPSGYSATAGTRKYIGTWGQVGDVPNAYLTEVLQISDIPGINLQGFWANKEKCPIATTGLTDKGYPVLKFRLDGVDHMWVRFRDGTENSADSLLLAKFASDPNYPWTSDMIGRGAPHVIVTTLYNRELFQAQPTFLFEPTPMRFYDLRKDSTNGGSGAHRWNNQATWEPTTNPVIMIYNIIRGIYYNGEWVYGGRNLPAFRLPPSNWIAAANECDVPINIAGGGTEPQFRAGMEITGDIEPLTAIEALKQSCNARMAEIGGIFEIVVGAPGAAVYAFTDDDIVVTRKQGYRSFPSLNETHNGIEATYPEPVEMWAAKDAPARFNATWETQDGGRRLATGVSFNAVPYGRQVQRLMKSLVADDRRWRVHNFALPPDAWVLTGTCVVSWTSPRNGYVNKKFLVTRIDGEPGMIQPVILREIDPSDYAWSSDEELPNPIGNLVIVRPSPQLVTGFQAYPSVIYDANGVARRPTIGFTYDGNMPDIRAVHVLVRLKASGAYVFDAELPFAVPYANDINGVFLPNTLYEVAIKYVPYSGRPTVFTEYQEVLTGNILLTAGLDFDPYEGVVGFDQLGPDLEGYQDWVGGNVRELYERLLENETATGHTALTTLATINQSERKLRAEVGNLSATFQEVITVSILPIEGQLQALADALTELSAADGDDINTARVRMTTMTGTAGYSRIGWETRFDPEDPAGWRATGFYMETPNNPALPTRILANADQFIMISGTNTSQPFVFDSGGLRLAVANIGTVTAGIMRSADGKFVIDLNAKRISIST